MIKIFLLTKSKINKYSEIKESKFGYVPGLHAPNEAGKILRDWFEKKPTPNQIKLIRNTVAIMSKKSGRPLLIKNLNNVNRLENIIRVFPKARFVHIKRDVLYNAQSILQSRKKTGDVNTWFGVKPPRYEEILKKSVYYQAIWQVNKINETIENLLKNKKIEMIQVTYEGFCQNPKTHIVDILLKYMVQGKNKKYHKLDNRNEVSFEKERWEDLKKSLNEVRCKKAPEY